MYTNYSRLTPNTICKGKHCDDMYKELVIYYETNDNLSDEVIDLKYKLLKRIACTKCY